MAALRKSLWTIAAMVALPAPAAAQEMCAALQRIAAAVREPVPFASLEKVRTPLVPGYDYCRVETGTAARAGGVFCHQQMAPESLIAGTVGAQVRDCLGAVPLPRQGFASADAYQTDSLSIGVSSRCDDRCHVGRIASLTIQRRREDGARLAR
jgi:hypothetical protein